MGYALRSVVVGALLWLGAASALAASLEQLLPPMRVWEASDLGISHQNWSVLQHSNGLMYVGNGNRLLEFDGVSWRHIATPNSGRVRSLVEGADGRVYAGGIDDFGVLDPDDSGKLRYQSLSAGHFAAFGDIWRVVRNNQDIYFMSRSMLFRYRAGTEIATQPTRTSFRNLFVVGGRLLVSEQDQLPAWLDFDTGARRPLACSEVYGANMVNAVADLGTDAVLLSAEHGAFRFDGQCLTPWASAHTELLRAAWPYAATSTSRGELAIGSIRGGLLIFDSQGRLLRQLRSVDGLPSDTVLGVGMDRDGGIWLAQEGGIARVEWAAGIAALRSAQLQALATLTRYRGTLLAGTALGVVAVRPGVDANTARIEAFGPETSNVNSLMAHDSGLLVASRDGLWLWQDAQKQRLVASDFAYGLSASRHLPNAVHVGLAPGYARLHYVNSRWQQDVRLMEVDDTIVTIAEDAQGDAWLGTERGRVYRLHWPGDDDSDGAVRVDRFDAAQGIPAGNAMPFDIGGEVVFATTQGVMRFDGVARFIPDMRFAAGIAQGESTAFRLKPAPDGRIYARIGGDTGWFEPRAQGAYVWHGQALDVLPKSSTLDFLIEDDGVWFARDRDLAFRAVRASPNGVATAPILLRALAHGERALYGGAGPLNLSAEPADTLAWHVDFAWPRFTAPQRIEYRARVVGEAADVWSPWRESATHTFERLPGGAYRLEVEARDALGRGTSAGQWLFAITPPWYATHWAQAMFVLASIGMLGLLTWLVAHARTRRLQAANARLEQQVLARTDEVRAQAEQLRAQDAAKTRFFANVSHEFRTPLTLILGPLDELRAGRFGALQDAIGAQVSTAARNARRLLGLVNQILDLNRLDAGHTRLRPRQADFAAFLRQSSEPFVALAERQSIRFERQGMDAEQPARFDAEQMDKVMQNLLANAFKFTRQGGSICLALHAENAQLLVSVRDTGIGIAAEDVAHVFERYYQSQGSTQSLQPGTGIGLALVKELVELHGGCVDVVSELGRGSTFTLRLPRHAPISATATADARLDEPAVETLFDTPSSLPAIAEPIRDEDDTRTTILVVDDNAELREFVAQRLRERYRVLFAADGEQGLAVARAQWPDLVVSDVMMPVCDGFTLLERLRADPHIDHVPVILLTAKNTADDLIAGLRKGADDYLVKPFDATELCVRIERLIAMRHRLRERYRQPADAAVVADAPMSSARTPSNEDPFLARVRAAAMRQLADSDFGVQELADAVHLDRTQLYRRLTQATGMTPLQFLRELRLDRAAELLRQRAGSVSEVAYGVGFESLSHFSRTYRERFGHAPSAERQADS